MMAIKDKEIPSELIYTIFTYLPFPTLMNLLPNPPLQLNHHTITQNILTTAVSYPNQVCTNDSSHTVRRAENNKVGLEGEREFKNCSNVYAPVLWQAFDLFESSSEVRKLLCARISFKYKDQGWGNRKGVVYVRNIPSCNINNKEKDDESVVNNDIDVVIREGEGEEEEGADGRRKNRVVCKHGLFRGRELGSKDKAAHPDRYKYVKGNAKHNWEDVCIDLKIEDFENGFVGVWVGIGGGGGHALIVKGFKAEVIEVAI